MTTKPLLIGLHGKPRVGKDTLAAHIIKRHNLLRYGPSVPLKNTCAAMFDVPRTYFDRDDMKDQVDPFWGITYRQMAQKVGKESSRDVFGDDIWLRHVEKLWTTIKNAPPDDGNPYGDFDRAPHYNGIILADVRYANEIEWVKKQGGDVIFVLRTNAPKSSDTGHVVDQGLPIDLADILIYNDGTIEDLGKNFDRLFKVYYSWEENQSF